MKKSLVYPTVCAVFSTFGIFHAVADDAPALETPGQDLRLYYDQPAKDWQTQALPIGNGRLGCMVFGGVSREHLQFNEDSLWIGDEQDTGAYQAFGDLHIDLPHYDHTDYQRELDIASALHTLRYRSGGVGYKRTYFASHPAGVMVLRFEADRPGMVTGRVTLSDSHAAPVVAENQQLSAAGSLGGLVYGKGDTRVTDGSQYKVALDYESGLGIMHDGGEVLISDGALVFKGCESVTLVLAAGTSFVRDREQNWSGVDPHARVAAQIDRAIAKGYDALLAEHLRDYQALFGRMSLNLGNAAQPTLPTDQRVMRYVRGTPDAALEALVFQFARYLMISSSRPGSQPANLQGLWNANNNPVWRSDYHSDINTQMNYWFVDRANLSECYEPFVEWMYSIREPRRLATLAEFGKPGWIMRVENGLFGGSTWLWSKGDASWLAQNLWDHYAFTLDKNLLANRLFPIQQDLCAFWLADLKELPDGKLVSPNGFSPEHGPHEDGVSFDQQVIWDLFTNTIESAEALDAEPGLVAELRSKRERLLGPTIGRWGQLQEWMVDRDDPEEDHRHFSHMIAVHPGRQISPRTTPELAEAAKVALAGRPTSGAGWSKAWRISLWARLLETEKAYSSLRSMFLVPAELTESAEVSNDLDAHRGGIVSNLLNTHPPFQIDGNFGYASGVCEMLLQSHLGELHLLPALPSNWSNGSVQGICGRGAFELDMTWEDGRLTQGEIRSRRGGECRVRTAEPLRVTSNGQEILVKREGGVTVFNTEAGHAFTLAVE